MCVMYVEIARIDAKGRITIPSYMRLVMGLESGSRVFMVYDEDRGVIEIRLVKPGELFLCTSEFVGVEDLKKLLDEYGLHIQTISCIRSNDGDGLKCRVLVDTPLEIEGFLCRSVES